MTQYRPVVRDPWRGPIDESAPATRSGMLICATLATGLVVGELLAASFGAAVAALAGALLAAICIGYAVVGRDATARRLVGILGLVAIGRTLSVVLPFRDLPALSWYALSSLPILTGAVLAARLFEKPRQRLYLQFRHRLLDASLAGLGIPVGIAGWWLLRPPPLIDASAPGQIIVAGAVLVGVAAATEELLFRGLLLAAVRALTRSDLLATASVAGLTFAVYLGAGSFGYTILMAALSAGLTISIGRGASLWGAIACHGLALLTMAVLAG